MIQRSIPVWIVTVTGILVMVGYFIPGLRLDGLIKILVKWTTIIAAIALWMGSISVALYQVEHIRKKTRGSWPYNAWALVAMFVTMALAIAYNRKGLYTVWTGATMLAIHSALDALQAPYIFSGAFRSWRIRRFETLLLVGAIVIVFFAQSPMGPVLIPGVQEVKTFMADSFSTAANRAMVLSAALGSLVLGFRTLMQKETAILGARIEVDE
jgi:hypothetical protein